MGGGVNEERVGEKIIRLNDPGHCDNASRLVQNVIDKPNSATKIRQDALITIGANKTRSIITQFRTRLRMVNGIVGGQDIQSRRPNPYSFPVVDDVVTDGNAIRGGAAQDDTIAAGDKTVGVMPEIRIVIVDEIVFDDKIRAGLAADAPDPDTLQ